jgi:hypothetical protein
VRSPQEVIDNAIGGAGEQIAHRVVECIDTPGEYLLYHDCAGVWLGKTINGKFYWDHQGNIGLWASQATSLEPDPVNSNRVILLASATNSIYQSVCGIYLSTDKTLTCSLKKAIPSHYGANPRRNNQVITYDPTTSDTVNKITSRAYLILPTPASNGAVPELWRTTDGGVNWASLGNVNGVTGSDVYAVKHDPTQTGVLWVGCANGFFKVTNAHGTPSWTKITNGLPGFTATDVSVFNVGGVTNIYVTFFNNGLYKSTNGGTSFTLVPGSNTFNGTYGPIYHAVNPNNLGNILVSGDNHATNARVTFNGGTSWQTPTMTARNWPEFAASDWHHSISNLESALVFSVTGKLLAHSCAKIFQSDNGGLNFFPADDGFDGYAWGWSNYNVDWASGNVNIVALFNFDNGMLISTDGGKGFAIKRLPSPVGVARVNSLKSGAVNANGSIQVAAGSEDFWDCRVGQRVGSADFTLANVSAGRGHATAFQPGTANVFCGQVWSNNNGAAGSWANLGYIFVGMGPGGTIFSSSDSNFTDIRRNGVAATGRTVQFTAGYGPWCFRPHPTNNMKGIMQDYTGDLAMYDWSVGGAAGWTVFGLLAMTESVPGSTNNIVACDIDPSNPARIAAGFVADGRNAMIFLSESSGAPGSWRNISGKLCRQGGLMSLRFHPTNGELWWCGNGPGRRIYNPLAV